MFRPVFLAPLAFCFACAEERDFASVASQAARENDPGDASVSQPSERDAAVADGETSVGELTVGIGRPAPSETERVDASTPESASSSLPVEAGTGPATTEPAPLPEKDAGGPPVEMSCSSGDDCDDGNLCNGIEECAEARCVQGSFVDNGVECESASGDPSVCRDGNCLLSRCGDGLVEVRLAEQCDDGNGVSGDGCDINCQYSCVSDQGCDDSNICNGAETCDLEYFVCMPGVPADDETNCGDGYACHGGRCTSIKCGDTVVDTGEECDDGNLELGDGCDATCAYECEADDDCDNGNVCDGIESCDSATHVCHGGVALDCNDKNACTDDQCDPARGCSPQLIDGDHDGQAPSSIDVCGTDCDDDNPEVFAGAGELCDGIDNNCDGKTDEVAPVWYPDCDGDGYAPEDSKGFQQCESPKGAPDGCERGLAGQWTSRPPKEGADCWDSDPAVYPRTDPAWSGVAILGRKDLPFDYNCNSKEEIRWTSVAVSKGAACSSIIIIDPPSPLPELELLVIQPPLLCSGAEGWLERVAPDCGKTGTYTYCNGCTREVIEGYTQQCQ